MSQSTSTNLISFDIVKFPLHLLIPNNENIISFQVTNSSDKIESYKFAFESENLNITIVSDDLKETIQFESKESKSFDLKLIPSKDGYGKISFFVNWIKLVEYTIKVQKVREIIATSKIDDIFKKHAFDFLKSDKNFEPKDYIISMTKEEISQIEKRLSAIQSSFSSNNDASAQFEVEEIDHDIKNLAKGYLSNNELQRALKLALELSNELERTNFYYCLIIAYASLDLERTIRFIVESNELSKDVVKDEISKVKLLLNIAKIFFDKKNKSSSIKALNQQIARVINSAKIKLSENNYKNPSYELLKDAISVMAEIERPKVADSIIEGIKDQKLKEKIAKDLFDLIYEMVEEIKTKTESIPILSQYYLFNTYVSEINEHVKKFSTGGGNVSNNLLVKKFDFNTTFISLFGLDFSIFPMFERAYIDLKNDLNREFAYYIYPSTNKHDESESQTIIHTLRQFLASKLPDRSRNLYLYNLDFIPYLGKPTIIVSSDPELIKVFQSKIKSLGENISFLIDDALFKGGFTFENLRKVFPSDNFKIANLVLSYEFISDYVAFKSVIESLIEK